MAMGPFRHVATSPARHRLEESASGGTSSGERAVVTHRRSVVRQGRFGQKSGSGWYRYEAGKRDALHDPAVDAIVDSYRRERGVVPAQDRRGRIVDRCILARVAKARFVLSYGVSRSARRHRVVYLTGYGFPRHRGGPMSTPIRAGCTTSRAAAHVRGAGRGRPRVLDAVAADRGGGA